MQLVEVQAVNSNAPKLARFRMEIDGMQNQGDQTRGSTSVLCLEQRVRSKVIKCVESADFQSELKATKFVTTPLLSRNGNR